MYDSLELGVHQQGTLSKSVPGQTLPIIPRLFRSLSCSCFQVGAYILEQVAIMLRRCRACYESWLFNVSCILSS
jgi:hypothetical protein